MSTTADYYRYEMKDILNDIAAQVLGQSDRPTDFWLRLGNIVQVCPSSSLSVSIPGGYTALGLAALCRQPIMCSLLLARGADVKTAFKTGDEAGLLKIMVRWESERIMWNGEGTCSRTMTAEAEVVRALISCGADVDAQNEGRYTLLRYACMSGHVKVLETLLAAPGERLGWEKSREIVIDAYDSPFLEAVYCGHLDVVKVLCRQEFRPRALVVSGTDAGPAFGRFARLQGFDALAEFLEGFAWVVLV